MLPAPGSGIPGPQAGVWAAPVVMDHPLLENSAEVSLIQLNEEIQTLAANRPDQSFAERIGLGRAERRLHFHDHEDVQDPKAGRHGDQEIAGEKGLGMVVKQTSPNAETRGAVGFLGYPAHSVERSEVRPESPVLTAVRRRCAPHPRSDSH